MPSYERILRTFRQMKREVAGIGAFVVLFVSQATPVCSSVVRAAEIESAATAISPDRLFLLSRPPFHR